MSGQPLSFDATPEEVILFISEGEEQLEILGQDILRLEQEGDANTELLQEIFRAAHTLKGSSGVMGHQRMARLTHATESVLDQVRHHQLPVTTVLIDLLLKGLDALHALLGEVTAGITSDIAIDDLCTDLIALANSQPTSSAAMPEAPSVTISAAALSQPFMMDDHQSAWQVWRVAVVIAPDCALPAARALQAVLACSQMGQVAQSAPSLEAIEAGQFGALATGNDPSVLTLWLALTSPHDEAALRRCLERIPEVSVAAITPPAGSKGEDSGSPEPAPATREPSSTAAASSGIRDPLPAVQAPRMVRIDVERLDALMNLIGELVISRKHLTRLCAPLLRHTANQIWAEDLAETSRHIARISDDLQDQVMRSRMLPIESVFSKFPRVMRDLAQRLGKKVDFIIEGQNTELDRSVAEQISDPLLHLLRNAIDHGMEAPEERLAGGKQETGQIRLAARHEENQIVIDVEDDGRGISPERLRARAISKGLLTPDAAARLGDREAVELIFAPGFSTAEQISDLSGRGVGMDIVRTNIERLSGSIMLETEAGQGSRFMIRLPLTLAIIRALLVRVAGQTYAMPLTAVVEALRVQESALRSINGHEAIELRGQVLPLIRLAEVFRELTPPERRAHFPIQASERFFVVAIRWGEFRSGLLVDSLIGEQEIVIKPLGEIFRHARGISGGAVLGDGQVAPILDIAALINQVMAGARGNLALRGVSI